jgi:hypothetical protein
MRLSRTVIFEPPQGWVWYPSAFGYIWCLYTTPVLHVVRCMDCVVRQVNVHVAHNPMGPLGRAARELELCGEGSLGKSN